MRGKVIDMMVYMISLNRALKFNDNKVNIFEYSIFSYKNEGLVPGLYNMFSKQNCKGSIVNHHNILPKGHLVKTLDHAICDFRSSL